jgi:zinc and cadmium transporter
MERFVFVHACEERDRDIHQMGIPAFLGISLHSLLDGIALGAGLILPQLGPVVLLAVIVTRCLTACPFLRSCWPQDGTGAR